MITNTDTSIIEEVRALKEANAAAHDFDVARIVAASKERQEASGRDVIRCLAGKSKREIDPEVKSSSAASPSAPMLG